jgi:hypothetical protein
MRSLAFLLVSLIAGAAPARRVIQIPTDPDANVQIQIESGYSRTPAWGYAPVDLTINNSSKRAHTWNFRFQSFSNSYGPATQTEQLYGSVTVEAGAARTSKILVPLCAFAGGFLSASVSGFGLAGEVAEIFSNGSSSGASMNSCMAVSDAAASKVGTQLEFTGVSGAEVVNVSAIDLPEDWRAYSGLEGLWILEREWGALSPSQRTALEDWIALGGRLILCSSNPPAPARRIGMGSIESVRVDPVNISSARQQWRDPVRGDLASVMQDDLTRWKSAQELGVLTPNLPLLIGFLAVFATVVGPLNLFVFARSGRRSRLFWTVPLISLGATGLLLVLIIVQDGLGGWGIRSALICLVPSARKAVVFQEQISRTGVIGATAFSVRDPVWMNMVKLGSASLPDRDSRSVENSDIHFAGEWFKSRSIQSQWIESVIPTRAEVALVNPGEVREGRAAPVIVSSIAAPLSDFWYWDFKGRVWGAVNVRAGVSTALAPGSAPKDLLPDARVSLRSRMARAQGVPGNFVAVSGDAASFIATLPSIRWKDRQAIYVGPVTGAEPLR